MGQASREVVKVQELNDLSRFLELTVLFEQVHCCNGGFLHAAFLTAINSLIISFIHCLVCHNNWKIYNIVCTFASIMLF
jgi:hypothetical protein